jgi:hypothetical protein
MLLMEVICLLGKVDWLMASRAFYTYSSFGMFIYFPDDLPTFLKHFSNSFQTLMFLSFVVMSFWYFPCPVSHCMPLMVSETC